MYFHVNTLYIASGIEWLTINAKQKISLEWITITSLQKQYDVFSHMLIYYINIIWLVL